MELTLKSIDVGGDFLVDHTPDNLEFFSLWITATIGFSGEDGGVMHQLHICTPDWLKYALRYEVTGGFIWGRHSLIVESFDAHNIEKLIIEKLKETSRNFPNDSPGDLIIKFGRYAYSEFEDYGTG
jgi:hypothetical protein